MSYVRVGSYLYLRKARELCCVFSVKTGQVRFGLAIVPSRHRTITDYSSTVRWHNGQSKPGTDDCIWKKCHQSFMTSFVESLNIVSTAIWNFHSPSKKNNNECLGLQTLKYAHTVDFIFFMNSCIINTPNSYPGTVNTGGIQQIFRLLISNSGTLNLPICPLFLPKRFGRVPLQGSREGYCEITWHLGTSDYLDYLSLQLVQIRPSLYISRYGQTIVSILSRGHLFVYEVKK